MNRTLPASAFLGFVLFASPALAGGGIIAPPEGARLIDFTDVFAPSNFVNTTALRDKYAPVGMTVTATGSDGGAILDESSGFLVSGYSPPSFLAFIGAGTLSGGGTPQFPIDLHFRHPIRYLQFNVGSFLGNDVSVQAFDADDTPLNDDSVQANATMQTLVLDGRHISRVRIMGGGNGTIIDDLAFVLDTTLIDFDDAAAPAGFSSTTALRDKYASKGVTFASPQVNDGGAILNSSSNFGVSGFSSPNFLAFADTATMQNGGKPRLPQYLLFLPAVRKVTMKVGDDAASTVSLEAHDSGGETVDTAQVVTASSLKSITVEAPEISTVIIESTGTDLVIDDLEFDIIGTLIDFDDLAPAPLSFAATSPLRDRYKPLGIQFRGDPNKNGASILDDSSNFSVTGYSAPNFLAFSSGAPNSEGGNAALPEILSFNPPIERLYLRVGDFGQHRITLETFDSAGNNTGSTYVDATSKMQSLWLEPEGAVRAVITSTGTSGVIDDVAFAPVEPCVHDVCHVGEALNRSCHFCTALVCEANADCCGDDWTTECAKSVSEVCEYYCPPRCGDANDDRDITASDALLALRTAVGSASCELARCDYNDDGDVLASDALAILRAAVGQPTSPKCPAAG